MRFATAIGMLLFLGGASLADANATRFQVANGKMIVAQTYCGICAEGNSTCRLGCNGAGTCIQACFDKYRECLRQNLCGR
jgi:hypothetical protein